MAGSTTYPTSVDNKTALQDGVDYMEADNVNNAYVPTNAVETFIGASGSGLSNNIDVLAFIQKTRSSLRLAYTDINTITVSLGEIMVLNSGGTIRMMKKNTSTTAVTFSNIDTGARALSTTYYIWAIGDAAGTTLTFKISTSGSAPASSTYYALVGKFATDAVGAGQIIENSVTSYVGNMLVNEQYYETGAVATGTTPHVYDDSIPQSGEGDQYMSLVYVAQDVLNLLEHDHIFWGALSASDPLIVALYQDSTANALAAVAVQTNAAASTQAVSLKHYMLAGTISATTFKIRAGASGAATTTFNGAASARKLGGVGASSMRIREYRRVYA